MDEVNNTSVSGFHINQFFEVFFVIKNKFYALLIFLYVNSTRSHNFQ